MKITKRQLRKIIKEESARLFEADPPGMPQGQYSVQAIANRISSAVHDVIDEYVQWHSRQGILSNVMDQIESDAKAIAGLVEDNVDVETDILMSMDIVASEQERAPIPNVSEAFGEYQSRPRGAHARRAADSGKTLVMAWTFLDDLLSMYPDPREYPGEWKDEVTRLRDMLQKKMDL